MAIQAEVRAREEQEALDWHYQVLVDVVNPRLSRYRMAGFGMALVILFVQLSGVCAMTVFYRFTGASTQSKLMSCEDVNDADAWTDPNVKLSSTRVPISDYVDFISYAEHGWKGFNTTTLAHHVDTRPSVFRLNLIGYANELHHRNVSYQNMFLINHTFKVAGARFYPCKARHLPCDQYYRPSPHGCDDQLQCKSSTNFVEVVVTKLMPWDECLPNAMAMVGYFEISATALVLFLYMVTVSGFNCSELRHVAMETAKRTSKRLSMRGTELAPGNEPTTGTMPAADTSSSQEALLQGRGQEMGQEVALSYFSRFAESVEGAEA